MNDKMTKLGFTKVSTAVLDKVEGFNPFEKIGKQWFLVTAGDEKGYNTMTASWGFAGVMWGKNTFTTVIRPQRHTKQFIDSNDYFTISFFDEDCRKALQFCGSHSGRDFDKAKETGLVPMYINDKTEAYSNEYAFDVTSFEQAKLVLVCKKSYIQPMTADCMLDKSDDEKWFPNKDYHVQYIGEIVCAYVKEV